MTKCFDKDFDSKLLDREPFSFGHHLLEHSALSLENLGRLLPALAANQIFYSKSTRDTGDDLDRLHESKRNGLSIEETISNIRTSDSYIMVRSPETDPSFAPLYRDLLVEVGQKLGMRGARAKLIDPMLYLFIASPGSVTPFHIDRYSTILMQFRGAKTVTIYPPWDQRVVDQRECEDYVAYAAPRGPRQRADGKAHGKAFHFSPGQALHIPFVAGHHVHNGSEDVSISMSIIFKTAQTERMRKAIMFNRKARQVFSRFGFQPAAVGQATWKDGLKATAQSAVHRTAQLLGSR